MKYLKLFENKTLDDILDKMLAHGKESLTKLELDYLKAMETGDESKVKKKMDREADLKSVKDYDPRKDKEFFDDLGMDFSNWSDKDIEEGRISILWDEFNPEEMDNFIKSYELDDSIKNSSWDKLPNDVKEYFQVYLYENDLIKTKEQEEIEIESAWDLLSDDDMDKFLGMHELPRSLQNTSWDKLPNEVKNIFTNYAKKSNLI